MRSKGNQQSSSSSSRLMRIITKPIRILIKAKDNYVKSMNNFADSANYSNFMGLPAGTMPRSYSVSSSDYDNKKLDLNELIRSASVNNTMDMYMIKKQLQDQVNQPAAMKNMGSTRVPRSCSVGMGKIDEDKPCDDFVDLGGTNKVTEFMHPRSRSYAMDRRNLVF